MRQCTKCGRQFEGNETVCPDDGAILEGGVSFEKRAVGKTLEGKYRIDGFLKRGGMGAVYRGTHLMLNKPVAIKLIKPELVSSSEVVQRFLREARAAAHLSHPNIVTVHDLGQTPDGMLYIVMELVPGSSLKEVIQAEGAWEAKRVVRLVKAIASALGVAHRNNVVHRDLKPQNIMVTRDSDGNEIPKLLDFGIAKTLEPTNAALTSTGMVLGTPHYMSTEQAKGAPADRRSDLYALGVILYEMLVGSVPFDDASIPQILIKHLTEMPLPPSSVNPGVPPELEAIVLRLLEKDPDRRYQNAEELIEALDGVEDIAVEIAAAPTIAVPAPTRDVTLAGGAATGTLRAHEVSGEPKRRGMIPVLALVIAVGALVALALLFLRGRSPEEVVEVVAEAPPPARSTPVPPEAGETSAPPAAPVAAAAAPAPPVAETAPSPSLASYPQGSSTGPIDPPPLAPPPRGEAAPPPEPPTAVALPAKPLVSIVCAGVRDGCAALRFAIIETCRRNGLRMARPARSDVHLRLAVEEIEARQEEQFGTTFVLRTYAVEAEGESPHFDDLMTLEPHMFTFDARLGREKMREQTRLFASDVVDALKAYWSNRVP